MFKDGNKLGKGRPKGSKNKKTELANFIVEEVLTHGSKDVKKIWDELKAKDKMEFIVKFLPFELPQKARIENENKMPSSITINMIPATPENKQLDNTINIEHEEIKD